LTLTTDKKQGTATIQKEDEKKRVWDHNTNGIVRVDVKIFFKKLSQQLKRRKKKKSSNCRCLLVFSLPFIG